MEKKIVLDEFNKCVESVDYLKRYPYFKEKNHLFEANDIKESLAIIEEQDLLGALYVLDAYEESIGNDYLSESLTRNITEIADGIKVNNDKNDYYVKAAIIYMFHMSESERDRFAEEVFGCDYYISDEMENTIVRDTEASMFYNRVFVEALLSFPSEILWRKKYIDPAISFYHARSNKEFFKFLESKIHDDKVGYDIDNAKAKEYLFFLCNLRLYSSARDFLYKFDGSKNIFGMEPKELIEFCLSCPSSDMVAYARWYYQKRNNVSYSADDWCADVLRLNNDPQIRNYIRVTTFFMRMYELLLEDDYEAFDKQILNVGQYEMFDMNVVHGNLKQVVESTVYVINKLIADGARSVFEFISTVNEINVYNLKRIRYFGTKNNFQKSHRDVNYNEIVEKLFDNYQMDEVVYVYMNSHLKHVYKLEKFIEMCAERVGSDLYEYFKDYPLHGIATCGTKAAAVRDKIFISPTIIMNGISYDEYNRICQTEPEGRYSEKAIEFKKKLIRNDERWYSNIANKPEAQLIKSKDHCTFVIKRYVPGVGIDATDIKMYDNIRKKREEERDTIYPKNVCKWLNKVISTKTCAEWDRNVAVWSVEYIGFVRQTIPYDGGYIPRKNVDLARVEIAVKILEAIEALADDYDELKKFLGKITNPPLEELNEFKYISTQTAHPFEMSKETFVEMKKTVVDISRRIMSHENLSKHVRKEIYINTCMKKFYEFLEACHYIGEEFYYDTAVKPFVMSMTYVKEKDGEYYFNTKQRDSIMYSAKDFVFRGENPGFADGTIREGREYLVELDSFDSDKWCYTLKRVNLTKDDVNLWDKFIRKIREVKRATSDQEFDEIARELENSPFKVKTDDHIKKFTFSLNEVFMDQKFSLKKVNRIIDTIGIKNPFNEPTDKFSRYQELFRSQYMTSYESFVERYIEDKNSPILFADLYFRSYLKVFVSVEQFLNDLQLDKDKRQGVLDHCYLAGYITPGSIN